MGVVAVVDVAVVDVAVVAVAAGGIELRWI